MIPIEHPYNNSSCANQPSNQRRLWSRPSSLMACGVATGFVRFGATKKDKDKPDRWISLMLLGILYVHLPHMSSVSCTWFRQVVDRFEWRIDKFDFRISAQIIPQDFRNSACPTDFFWGGTLGYPQFWGVLWGSDKVSQPSSKASLWESFGEDVRPYPQNLKTAQEVEAKDLGDAIRDFFGSKQADQRGT